MSIQRFSAPYLQHPVRQGMCSPAAAPPKAEEEAPMKKTRQEKQQDKKDFRKALQQELREHKSSFIVFYTLRALAIVI